MQVFDFTVLAHIITSNKLLKDNLFVRSIARLANRRILTSDGSLVLERSRASSTIDCIYDILFHFFLQNESDAQHRAAAGAHGQISRRCH